MIRRFRIRTDYEFRLMKKRKGSHLKRPQIHIGNPWGSLGEYHAMSDSKVIELRDWLSRYINENIKQTPESELLKSSRASAMRVVKNINKMESKI